MNVFSYRTVTTAVSQSEKELLNEINDLKKLLESKIEEIRSTRLLTLYKEIDSDQLKYGDLIYNCSTNSTYCCFSSLRLIEDDFGETIDSAVVDIKQISDSCCKNKLEEETQD